MLTETLKASALFVVVLVGLTVGFRRQPDEANAGDITVSSLTIVSGDGKHKIRMVGQPKGVGIWVHGPHGNNAAVVSDWRNPSPFFGLQNNNELAARWAVFLEDGVPLIQARDKDGKVVYGPARGTQ